MPPDTRIGPAVDGIIFHRNDPIRNVCLVEPQSSHPEKYVLSMIWLPLKPGYDVLNCQSAAARLWHASLDYIRCIRGCVELCWGQDIEASEPALVLLIQWAAVWAWKSFQQSPGVSLITGILRGNPLNRTVNLHPAYLYGPEKIMEIVFLSIDPGTETTVIEADLIHLQATAVKSSKVDYYTDVAERYASLNPLSSAGQERAGKLPDILASLAIWNESDYYKASSNQDLIDAAQLLLSKSVCLTRFSAKLSRVELDPVYSFRPSPVIECMAWSTADLLTLPHFRRQGSFPGGLRTKSYSFAPRMGEMNEFHESVPMYAPIETSDIRKAEKLWVGEDTRPLALDMFEIRIMPTSGMVKNEDMIALSSDLFDQVERLRREIESYEGCQTVLVAHVHSLISTPNVDVKTDIFQLLVFWAVNSLSLPTQREKCRKRVADAMESTSEVQLPILIHQMPDVSHIFKTESPKMPVYEITHFFVPTRDKDLFQQAFSGYTKINKLEYGPHIVGDYRPEPMQNYGCGWSPGTFSRDGHSQQMACYTSVRWWRCASEAAGWYAHFVSQVKEGGYERMGFQLDALRLTASGGAESTFLTIFEPVTGMD
ncbi:hypothetical protein V501_06155 [Pseudogymnoascus sp. VKM F-4519 (FW-2642)]|nr:hypothetical protein V501_06155 [Pseudogymnoascus sp. VKM F-4519 (FW-2642)]